MVRRSRFGLVAAVLVLAASACSGDERADDAESIVSTSILAPAAGAGAIDTSPSDFVPLNPAVGYGMLRVMTLDERPNPRDVVIYEAIPNELPRVAGVITTVEQTPLSHVNLRAVQDAVPNAFIASALDDPGIADLVGTTVKYTVTADGFTIVAATPADVEEHHAASRPAEPAVLDRDLSVTAVTPLVDVGFDDWTAFGVKAANVATMATFGLPEGMVPDGWAVPFALYVEFMTANGFLDRVRDLLADPAFQQEPEVQEAELAELRDDIESASVPPSVLAELDRLQAQIPEGASMRCRSSTNNEDLPDFSGAGLYDSFTQRPDEGHIEKCIKQVYASLWTFRAFVEREFHRVDHLQVAMGVLVHPNFDDELANGVAVSTDPVYETPEAFYVNVQLGEDLVTNPQALSIPEQLLLGPDGVVTLVQHSNQIDFDTQVLDDAHAIELRRALEIIHDEFAALYGAMPGESFAMEIEFKIESTGTLAIKQARPWIFT